ncbi:MAG TPA: c-type cytochrome, partial [Pirellulaceae bacterium]|nr:c-type cytochrome [Pirellulaceae bacterium]
VYLIDWYDRNACHRTNPEIWDRTNGRIYQIAYGVPRREQVDLSALSDAELARLAWHRNDWHVRVSRRILQERASKGTLDVASVRREIDSLLASDDDTRVLRGMWLGHATGVSSEREWTELLSHTSPYVSAWAIQILCERRDVSAATVKAFAELAADAQRDSIVRLYLASALQRLAPDQRWDIAGQLLAHAADDADQNLPLMIWYGIEPLIASQPQRALAWVETSQLPRVSAFIVRRAAADAAALDVVVAAIPNWSPEGQQMALEQINEALVGRVNVPLPASWQATYEKLSQSEHATLRELSLRLAVAFGDRRAFPQLREILADPERPLADRQRALEILVQGRDQEAAPAMFAALEAPQLQSPVIRALAALADPETPGRLLRHYGVLVGNAKEDAIATLVSRAVYAEQLLDAIEAGLIPRSDVHAYHVRQLANLGDQPLMARVTQLWGRVGDSSEEQKAAIERYKSLLTGDVMTEADVSHGRLLYNKHCAACHRLFGEGEQVGPDLTGSNRADLDYILENLVAPNAVVGKDYQMTLLQLIDGRVVSGLIMRETDSALTLKTINDMVIIPLDDIEEQKLSDLSLMPNGLLDPLPLEEVRDLIAYLASPSQVPLKGPRAPIDAATGKVAGALEGESLKVLEVTRGSAGPQDMRGFNKDRWSGHSQLWWTGGQPGDQLVLEFEVADAGIYEVQLVLTRARDYGIVQHYLNGQSLGEAVDLYNSPDVITTGVLSFPSWELAAGKHRLSVQITGRHPQSVPAHMFGLDFLRLVPMDPSE